MYSQRWTRRSALSMLAAAGVRRLEADTGEQLPPERVRYADPATEFPVWRLTDPAHTCRLPGRSCRSIARRGDFLLFWSDRTGSSQVFKIDLRTGGLEQVTQAQDLDGSSIALLPGDESFCYFDGPSLMLSRRKPPDRALYSIPEGWRKAPGFAIESDGTHGVLAESAGRGSRIRLVALARGAVRTILEIPDQAAFPLPRPRRDSVLYRRGPDSLWLADYDGRQNRRLATAPGRIGPAFWSPEGQTVLYLSIPAEPGRLNTIREMDPDTGADRLVAATSQFAGFAANGDASVFVGASGSKASPYVLLLLRVTRRELALCEHRASDPALVGPIFSPDSHRIYFESDRDGKAGIYEMRVDRFVEETPA